MVTNLRGAKLPVGWQFCVLPEFSHIVMGQSPSSDTYNFEQNGLPFFQGKTEFGDICPTVNKFCSKPNKIANTGATLLSVRAPVGPTNLANQECCIGRGLAAIHPYCEIDSKFILFLFRSIEPDMSGKGTGSTFKAITKVFIEELEFALPPLFEQHRIVAKIEELFSELDKGIESLKTARGQLKVYRQALLKQAFEGKLTEQWRKDNADKLETSEQLFARIQQERDARYQQQLEEWKEAVRRWGDGGMEGRKPVKPKTYSEKPHLTEEETSSLPKVSEYCVYTYLAGLGDLGRGKSKHRPRNDPRLFGGAYPFIQTGEVKAANRVIKTYNQTLSEFGIAQSKLWPAGTLCITIAANIAETAFLGFDGCFPDSIVGFTSFENLVDPKYIELFIMSIRVRIEAYAPATAQKNINLTILENLIVPLTSLEEQKTIIKIVDEQFSVIDQNIQEIEDNLLRAEALRQSILKKAFSGQLVPQDPNDEPASELLKRIATEKAAIEAQAKATKDAVKKVTKAKKKQVRRKAI